MDHIPTDPINLSRMNDRVNKKIHKQEKFLKVVQHNNVMSIRLSLGDVANDVIVFDGSASHPPPPISPPKNVSSIYLEIMHIYFCQIRLILSMY